MKFLHALLLLLSLAAVSVAAAPRPAPAPGQYFEVTYPPSTAEGELQLGVTYTVWIPAGVKQVRGVIVHQHGCGTGACKGGETAAYDLHWQALAKKWDCALMGPSYHQDDQQNCRLWCDPRNGSSKAFTRALAELGAKSRHPELEKAPWCLWGHSGGGFWASLMQAQYPERIVAIWFRSGTAFETWENGDIPKPELPSAAMQIPMMCNPGARENGDARFNGAWTGLMSMFRAYRAKGAPIGFAPDPRTGHECGDSRYLAIPFFDACLEQRLPDRAGKPLKPVALMKGYLAPLLGSRAEPTEDFKGSRVDAVWLPSREVAEAWSEYVKSGAVADPTPPPPPTDLRAVARDGGVELTWNAEADFESGIRSFLVQRDFKEVARVPERPSGRFGRPLFQAMSYHDTPEKPLPEMRWVDTDVKPGERHQYTVITVNGVGLTSIRSRPVVWK